ncbi:Endo-1,4-beta-xylanase A precursor [[Actinomadura] parvosata subsp. kistnae]|uniref:Esterase n=1 Tax=[Actinomadura] parvosata subsp. kistnae TaxID=1909395 RepID=A0A1U9ZV93_9ACTN|nr:alpha/beta hydrolase-fold protein [Nonomuraea sp. ATCC 55076]AQZ61857.1 esterase [Nonomuraea sp. ATCC 55076]SPL88001.1 Endo-1,4-beta-xylanase A precursor [Actinomadura parvosata subsp. kistnae]
MPSSGTYHGSSRAQGGRRRLQAAVTGAVLIATALAAPRPAVAAADTPWLNLSQDGYASFSLPAAAVEAGVGQVSQVVIEGNFGPSATWAEYGLTRRGDVWSGVLGPLKPGLYSYQVTGDDTKGLKDPTNGTGVASKPLWSTFFVPGESARLLADVPQGQGGKVETLTYRAQQQERSALVWTPPGYAPRGPKAYPVLYLQPGDGGSASDWLDLGRAKQILDNLAAQKAIEPMVVAISDAGGTDDDLRAAVAGRYRVLRDPAHQAIAGIGAGGAQAVRAALARPERFAYAGSFSGLAADDPGRALNRHPKLLRLYTGNVTDPAYNATYKLTKALDRARVGYEFDGVNPDAGGNWNAWQENLIDFLPRLFRKVRDHGPSDGHGPLKGEFTPPAPGTTPTPFVTKDGFVTFETTTAFKDAQQVKVWANWAPNGSWLRVPATRAGDRWRVTVGPLDPWFYYYRFIVDRTSVKDASNPTKVTSEPTWSTFMVDGERSRLLSDVPAGQGGKVESMTYRSTVANADRTALVWTPPGYDPNRAEPYPVFYLQHGGGQSYTDWVEMGRAKQILDHLSLDGKLEPMVVVMGNGNVPDFNKELLENIVPAARSHYHVSSDPARQALAGLSMGGGQTFGVLKAYPGRFAYVAAFSAGFGSATGVDAQAINNGTKLLRLYVGDQTDFVYPSFMTSLTTLNTLGIRYEFDGVTPGPHGWDVWQKNLIDLAPRLFKR